MDEPRCVECGAFEDAVTVLRVSNGCGGDGEYRCQHCAQAVDIRHCGMCGEENTDLLNDDDLCFCCDAHADHPTLELPMCPRCPARDPCSVAYGRCDTCVRAAEIIIAKANGQGQ